MGFLILIGFYILLTIILLLLFKKVRIWISGIATILFFPYVIFCFFYLFNIAVERHYNVQKGTFLWFATMWSKKTITDFPVLEPVGKPTYNSIGGDSPSIGAGWEIEYVSKMKYEILKPKIIEYLRNDGYKIIEVEESEWYSIGLEKERKSNSNQYFSGEKKNEGLYLWFQKQGDLTNIKCTIIE